TNTTYSNAYKGFTTINMNRFDSNYNYNSLQIFASKRAGVVTSTLAYTSPPRTFWPACAHGLMPTRGAGRSTGAGGVETTTRHACAAPRRLGSIRARGVRRRMAGTGPFDPSRTGPPGRVCRLRPTRDVRPCGHSA